MSHFDQEIGLLDALSSYINEAIFIFKIDDASCLFASPQACQMLQAKNELSAKISLFDIDLELRSLSQWQQYCQVVQRDASRVELTSYLRQDQTSISVEVKGKAISFKGQHALLLTVRDVSSRRIYEQKVHSDEALRTFTLHEAQDGFWDWNVPENTLYLSPHCFRLMRVNQDEVTGPVLDLWLSVIHPEDKKLAFQTIDDHVKGKTERFKIKYRLVQTNGHYIWVQGRGATVQKDENGLPICIIGSVIDITESESTTQSLMWQAKHDALTGVFNRKTGYELFQDCLSRVNRAIKAGQTAYFQVVVLDLDDFKLVNDNYGHLIGDELLKHCAAFISQRIKENMTLARWGGEEFVLLCYGYKNQDMMEFIRDLIKDYGQHAYSMADGQIYTSISAGMSFYKDEHDSISSLFQVADQAMYQAKARGKNQLVCDF